MACAAENKALDEYLELRDAKSNGCCHGWPISKIIEYDNRIEAAAERLKDARAEVKRILDGNIECM